MQMVGGLHAWRRQPARVAARRLLTWGAVPEAMAAAAAPGALPAAPGSAAVPGLAVPALMSCGGGVGDRGTLTRCRKWVR